MSRLSDYNKLNANIKKITPGEPALTKGVSSKLPRSKDSLTGDVPVQDPFMD